MTDKAPLLKRNSSWAEEEYRRINNIKAGMASDHPTIKALEELARSLLSVTAADLESLRFALYRYGPDAPGSATVRVAMILMVESLNDIDQGDKDRFRASITNIEI